ncbi:IQ domain-containing protein E isoform X1 [Denticeps clupeoides]|uniref:IQ domain-containing protein E n=1 Tax=Denticeps clupeoides TaxID=299321 RepID=A0AAY4AHA6_9TELE|nr:IQ domain-containing protein E isoform X1 [Denticeps clupeoides]
MSADACDFVSDEELEDLGEDGLSQATCVSDLEKIRKKRTPSKPLSPRSPYLTSANLHQRRPPAAAWKTAEFDVTHARLSMTTSTPEYLKEALGMKKPKHSRSASNGYTPGTPNFKDREEMYEEIIELKKNLQTQKMEADQLKAKVRRLEENNSRKEKQIEQLLDPTKGPEYSRSLLDKKTEGRAVVNGLKQKILRLEQQCREKESALRRLQSDLRTTNMEEMKITMETYYEEVQRLKNLLESAEKSHRTEGTENQRQQKVLRTTVFKLSKNVKQLEEENGRLRQEVVQEENVTMGGGTSSRAKSYMDWSKQRLVRRILDLEERLEELKKRCSTKDSRADQRSEDAPPASAAPGSVALQLVSVATETDAPLSEGGDIQQECARLRQEREALTSREKELRHLLAEREQDSAEQAKKIEELKREHQTETWQQRDEIENLSLNIKDLQSQLEKEKKRHQDQDGTQVHEKPSSLVLRQDEEQTKKNQAARIIQRHWHSHRNRDLILLQSAVRAHLSRKQQLLTLQSNNSKFCKSLRADVRCGTENSPVLEEEEVTLLQSAFRSHSKRRALISSRTGNDGDAKAIFPLRVMPTPAPRLNLATQHDGKKQAKDMRVEKSLSPFNDHSQIDSSSKKPLPAKLQFPPPLTTDVLKTCDSDDSDDIIVSPSQPLRKRESFF